MQSDGFNPTLFKLCAWCGVIFVMMWLGGAGPMSSWLYLPPPSAADTAATTLADYTSRDLMLMRIGITLANFSCVFYLAWGMAVTLLARKVEGDYPLLFYIQVLSLAACVVVILYIAYFWGAAMWRPGETSADVTQALNDLGWLGVLYTGAPFASYQIALGVVTLSDKSPQPVYPRWSAYFNFFSSFFMFEAAGILLFKTGPFSQNGLFVFYMPMVIFFVWILVFSGLAMRAVRAKVALDGRA
ncbi:MAG TPA: hypothetical protein VFY35_01625 [Burkholderiaceae bacterium]|nr:hypothetical protein [Burkholderiaceae bacterium]